MRIGVYNYHSGKNQTNEMFDNPKLGIGDDLMKPFQVLRNTFRESGHDLVSISDGPMKDFDALLFIEWPTFPFLLNPYFIEARKQKKKMYLLIMESEVIRPSNYNGLYHKYFEKIFTWKDDIVDGIKYIKYNWPQNIPQDIVFNNKKRGKFLTLISSNKLSDHPFELYSERIKAIRFFEKTAPESFDLYGGGWAKTTFRSRFLKYANLLPGYTLLCQVHKMIFYKPFSSWKGRVESKFQTLSEYKFAICYENARYIPGYITEKIFDCFFAGCIPIYLGPPNIDDFIPSDTYIDKNKFASYDLLYEYLQGLTSEEMRNYQDNALKFLKSEQGKAFSSESFSKIILNGIIN